MELIRDEENNKIFLVDDGVKVLETGTIGAEVVICLYTKEVEVTKDTDCYLYNGLTQLMNNNYIFDEMGLSYKTDNEICWFSDQYCDVDREEIDQIGRLIIRKVDDRFQFVYKNPFLEREKIDKKQMMIAFSPAGNGFYSKNVETGFTFQDDVVMMITEVLNKKTDKIKVKGWR